MNTYPTRAIDPQDTQTRNVNIEKLKAVRSDGFNDGYEGHQYNNNYPLPYWWAYEFGHRDGRKAAAELEAVRGA